MPGVLGLLPIFQALDTGADPAALSAARCGACHTSEYADWSGSRHRSSHTNAIYQVGLMAEPAKFCVTCHAPLAEQAAEVLPNLLWYREQGPHASGRPVGERRPEPMAEEGVSCPVCHLRGGTVLTPTATSAIHPTREEPALASGEVCRACHSFAFPEQREGGLILTDLMMQDTWGEWERWGGAQSCVDCHMPEGRHLFRGAHDLGWLKASVRVRREGRDLVVESVGVGHSLPSGDLFRHLTLEVDGREVAWIGRRFRLEQGPDGQMHQVLVSDTSLLPGVPQRYPAGRTWRLVYHYGSERDEARGYLAEEELYAVLGEG